MFAYAFKRVADGVTCEVQVCWFVRGQVASVTDIPYCGSS